MKCLLSTSPSAAEFLEATKKLYVKTDALIQRRLEPGQPRIFQSTDEDEETCCKLPSPCAFTPRIPSKKSAFRLICVPNRTIRADPRNEHIETVSRSLSPPPLYPRSTSLAQYSSMKKTLDWKPTPKPRLSIMKSMEEHPMKESERPQPKPRQKIHSNEYTRQGEVHPVSADALRNSPLSYRRKNITKSSPNISAPSVAALKRRVHSSRPATPVTLTEEPSVMFPVMDESERDFLRAAVRLTYSTDDEDSSSPSPSYGHNSFTFNPGMGRSEEKHCVPQSPAADSGQPNSDDEDRRTHPCSTKSLDDGFFDLSYHKKGEDTPSEALTSISNSPKITDQNPDDEVRASHLSILEKNARVMRWIHGCAAPPVFIGTP
ncbi:hypothetical protein NECAME_05302 [Necator americanus]|uniref:Uncharacterized protein n=1 Tax=Necator americanus TaxID=51031 RepID=W2SI50_NECAM|nr:hypothetical protein NECAME_05302 [Necator americanus]ETN69319.1 hypothetical protein NECAME_05302 [Necator americanus]